jgi:4-hydroxybenzoyl-CoA thioesterase/acyl-CoA thioester hydrolase
VAYTTERRIEFRDTDAAGIVHFSAFFALMESAEHEMLRSLGLTVFPDFSDISEDGPVTWPRVSASCDYTSAARFEDVLQISVRVGEMGKSSVKHHFDFSRDGAKIAAGSMTAVCCRLQGGRLEKAAIPESIRQLLAQHQ